MSGDQRAIVFERVTRRYDMTLALDALSFEVAPGEMFGLIGPDGAGKTTTIRLACGLLAPHGGRVEIAGVDPVCEHRRVTRSVGYLSQRFSLYGDLSVDENIAFFAEIHGLRRYTARRERLLEMMQLTPFRRRLADRLSGGMRQKLALACTLVHEPDVILLDEPTTGVDPVSRQEFWKLLSEFLAQGITILMATPYLDEAERCGRVALIHLGRALVVDRPARLRRTLSGTVIEIIARPRAQALEVVSIVPGVVDVQAFGGRAHVRVAPEAVSGAEARLRAALVGAGVEVIGLRAVQTSLEDVFIDRIVHASKRAHDVAEAS